MRHQEKKIAIVVPFRQADSLTELEREGARPMLAEALKTKADTFAAQLVGRDLPDGRHHVVRHGHAAVWTILAEIGPIALQRAKVGERAAVSRALEDLVQESSLTQWLGINECEGRRSWPRGRKEEPHVSSYS